VLGILGVLTGLPILLFFVAGPLGLLAVVFGAVSRQRADRVGAPQRKLATAGVALGIAAMTLAVFDLDALFLIVAIKG
jgi:hypothetical protein